MEDQNIEDSEAQILDMVSRCRNCNYCYSDCPLFESTRGLPAQGPSGLTTAIYYAIRWNLLEGKDAEDLRDLLYSCTTCGSCELRCKKSATGIPIVEMIEASRRILLEKMIGPLPEQVKVLEALEMEGNPYGEPEEKRTNWLEEIDENLLEQVKVIKGEEQVETMLFVGCTASYERDLLDIPRSIMKIMNHLDTNYGILKQEKCCGDPALRIGEAGLFEQLMEFNTENLKNAGAKRVVTISPHCYNSFKKEYHNLKDELEIKHYTEFFADQLEAGNLVIKKRLHNIITYQDPCYLGKKNGVYEAPRQILEEIAGDHFIEMERNRADSLCCGGGGGRIYAEVEEIKRLSEIRVQEALDVGAEIIVTACPWCYIQLTDGVKTSGNENKIEVKDLSELLAGSL